MIRNYTRWLVRALLVVLVAIGAVRVVVAARQAQTPPPQGAGGQGAGAPQPAAAQAPRVMTPEQRAYSEALALKDPAEKLAALRTLQTDFPAAPLAMTADSAILDLYLASWPDKTDEIAKLADTVVGHTPATATPEARFNARVAVTTKLVDRKILLDHCAALLTPALADLDMARYVAASKAAAATANPNRPAPADATLETTFKSIRSRGEELLGRIAFEKGDLNTAETFFKDGLADSTTLLRAPIGLAEIDVKRGDDKGALDYYMIPAVQGKLTSGDDVAFHALYAKVHGSTAGLEKDLDALYEEKFPNPVKSEKYTPTAGADRMVLVEMFTGSGCPPCVAADLALEGLMARYPDTSVAIVAYHENIPQPDPMVVPGAAARFEYYKNPAPASHGVPTIAIDGRDKVGGGARDGAPNTYSGYVRTIDAALGAPAKAAIALRAWVEGSRVKVTATVSKVAAGTKEPRLQLVLAEQRLRFTGENGIRFHDLVVRSIAGDQNTGFPLAATGDTVVEYSFDLASLPDGIVTTLAAEMQKRHGTEPAGSTPRDYRAEGHAMTTIDPSALSVVAFVQTADRDVLQATRTGVAATATKAGKGGGR